MSDKLPLQKKPLSKQPLSKKIKDNPSSSSFLDNSKSSSTSSSDSKSSSSRSSFRDSKFAKFNHRYNNSGSFVLILKFIFGLLILSCLIRYYVALNSGREPVYPTFRSLLETFSNFPDVLIPYVSGFVSDWLAESAWGIFEVFKPVIQLFVFFHDLFMFTLNAFLNIIFSVVFVFRWLFVG